MLPGRVRFIWRGRVKPQWRRQAMTRKTSDDATAEQAVLEYCSRLVISLVVLALFAADSRMLAAVVVKQVTTFPRAAEELVRIEPREDPAERVVRRNAVRQFKEPGEPVLLHLAEAFDIGPAFSGAQRDDHHVGQGVQFRPLEPRIGELFKVCKNGRRRYRIHKSSSMPRTQKQAHAARLTCEFSLQHLHHSKKMRLPCHLPLPRPSAHSNPLIYPSLQPVTPPSLHPRWGTAAACRALVGESGASRWL